MVTRLALVADEEIFEQLLGFMGVAVLHQLLQPYGEQHLWRGKWGRGKWEVSEEAEVGVVVMAAVEQHLEASECADPLGVGARQAGQELLQERTVDVLEARALSEDVGAAGAGGVRAADEGGRERCRPAHEGTGEVGADLPERPLRHLLLKLPEKLSVEGRAVRLPEAVV